MRILWAVAILVNIVFAAGQNLKDMTLLELFNHKYYTYICDKRWKYINKYNNKREDLLSLVAYACLKKRYLTPALDLAKVLKTTKEGRKNATYIVTLFLMKKFIIQMVEDDLNIGNIKLPQITDNTMGVVFHYLEKGDYKKEKKALVLNIGDKTYKITVSKTNDVVIETYINNVLKSREYYW